jgi:hypothetical protein
MCRQGGQQGQGLISEERMKDVKRSRTRPIRKVWVRPSVPLQPIYSFPPIFPHLYHRYEQQLQTQRMRLVADADLRMEGVEASRCGC